MIYFHDRKTMQSISEESIYKWKSTDFGTVIWGIAAFRYILQMVVDRLTHL